MAEPLNPYEAWLGIPPAEQPPDYYRLLGIARFEKNPRTISQAAKQRLALLQSHLNGPAGEAAKKLIGEVNAARVCLLNETRRAGYDRMLLQRVAAAVVETESGGAAARLSAEQFLEILARKDLVPPDLLVGLRNEIVAAQQYVSATTVAQALIDRGLLTPAIVKRLLMAGAEEAAETDHRSEPEHRQVAAEPPRGEAEEAGIALADESQSALPMPEGDDADRREVKSPHLPPTAGLSPPSFPPRKTPPKIVDEFEQLYRAPTEEKVGRPSAAADDGDDSYELADAPPAAEPQLDEPAAEDAVTAKPAHAEKHRPPHETPSAPLTRRHRETPAASLLDEGDLPAASASPAASATAAAAPKRVAHGLKEAGRAPIRLPWLWIGAAATVVVALLAVVLFLALRPSAGDSAAALLAAADARFDANDYPAAADAYTRFVEQYPDDPSRSRAVVRAGLAQLSLPLGPPPDWSSFVGRAGELLPQLVDEAAFADEARRRVADALLQCARASLAATEAHSDAAALDRAAQTLRLLETYFDSTPTVEQIDPLRQSIHQALRRMAREQALATALPPLRVAAAAGEADKVGALRRPLLSGYPELERQAELRQITVDLAAAVGGKVRWAAQAGGTNAVGPTAADTVATTSLAVRWETGSAAAPTGQAAGAIWPLATRTAVVGFDAVAGRMVWQRARRLLAAEQGRPPQPLPNGGDCFWVEPSSGEVARIETAGGTSRWQRTLGEPCVTPPALLGGDLYVATRAGRVWRIDAATGDLRGYVQLPQPLDVGPCVDSARGLLFQTAACEMLYVVRVPSGQLAQAVDLGQAPGDVRLPPVVAGNALVVARDVGARDTRLDLFALDSGSSSAAVGATLATTTLPGRLDAPPAIGAGLLLTASDIGEARLYQASDRPGAGMRLMGRHDARRFPLVAASFAALGDGQAWIGDQGLRRLSLAAAADPWPAAWSSPERWPTEQPPLVSQGMVYWAHRALAGQMAAAWNAAGGAASWQTQFAAPLCTAPWLRDAQGRLMACSSAGAVFPIADSANAATIVARARLPGLPEQWSAGAALELSDGKIALTAAPGSRGWIVMSLDSAATGAPEAAGDSTGGARGEATPRYVTGSAALACEPAVFGGALLVATMPGELRLVDPADGRLRAAPLANYDRKTAGSAWRALVSPRGASPPEAYAVEGTSRLVRIGLKSAAAATVGAAPDAAIPVGSSLAVLVTKPLPAPLSGPMALDAGRLWLVDAGPSLRAFDRGELNQVVETTLAAPCRWGPWIVGAAGKDERIIVGLENGEVLCFGEDGAARCRFSAADLNRPAEESPRAERQPVGQPLLAGESVWLAWSDGTLTRHALATGEASGRLSLQVPLASGPVLCGERIVVADVDGNVLQAPLPRP